jgi:hypothetical protein
MITFITKHFGEYYKISHSLTFRFGSETNSDQFFKGLQTEISTLRVLMVSQCSDGGKNMNIII